MGHFSNEEIMCRCGCGQIQADPYFLRLLNQLRDKLNRPLMVNSFYRCPQHDASIRGHGNHTTGKAVDLVCATTRERGEIIKAWTQIVRAENDRWIDSGHFPETHVPYRIGIGKTFLHIDIVTELPTGELKLNPAVWTY